MEYSSRRIIIVGFGLILLLLLFITATGLKNMSTINERMSDVVSVRNVKVDLVANMRNIARERSLALYHMVMSRDLFVTDNEKIKMSLLAGDFIEAREHLYQIGLDAEEQQLLDAALELAYSSTRVQLQIISLMEKEQYHEATALLVEKSLPLQDRLLNQYDAILNFERSLSVAAANDAREAYNTSFVTMLILGGIVILLALVISMYVVRTTSRAEKKLQQLNTLLENRVEARTAELQRINKELESFSYAVSHDLRAPIRSMIGFSQALLEDYADKIDAEGRDFLQRIRNAGANMNELIDALLNLSRLTRAELKKQKACISDLATELVEELQSEQPDLHVKFVIEKHLTASFDASLLRIALLNLFNNAIKFSRAKANPLVEFGAFSNANNAQIFYVRDNGVGFDMQYADRLFGAFQRLHSHREFEGIGIGLATVARIIHHHHGEIWAEAETGKGATIYFTLNGSTDEKNSHFYPYQKAG
jgi:signal transduction histidine kinase